MLTRASEIDSFTHRAQLLAPEYPAINSVLNTITAKRIQEAVQEVNSKFPGQCAPVLAVEQAVNERIGTLYIAGVDSMLGIIEDDMNRARSEYYRDTNGTYLPLPIMKTPTHEHIYRDFDFWNERGFITAGRFIEFVTAKLLDRQGQSVVIGSDKTSHFFSTGKEYLDYYRQYLLKVAGSTLSPAYTEKMAFDSTIQFGVETEIGKYGFGSGSIGTGVFSYADMVSNFDGLRFWSLLTPQEGQDGAPPAAAAVPNGPSFLPKMFTATWKNMTADQRQAEASRPPLRLLYDRQPIPEPYLKCKDGQWSVHRSFEWEDFVNPGWDENINANAFLTSERQAKFMKRIGELYEQGKLPRATFPMEPQLCSTLAPTAPAAILPVILNPVCYALAMQVPFIKP